MKKNKKTRLMAAILAAAASGLTGCDTNSDSVQTVYGPPQTNEVTSAATSEYDPAKDDVQDVYGPPVTEAKEESTAPTTEYAPEKETVAALYGPPPIEEEESLLRRRLQNMCPPMTGYSWYTVHPRASETKLYKAV